MARSTEEQVIRALVQTVRANTALRSQLSGGIHEDVAPVDTSYPFLTYSLVYGLVDDDWSHRTLRSAFDVWVVTENDPVKASNLDSLVAQTLEDSLADVDGQTTLLCRRIAGLRDTEITGTRKRITRVGGTYSIWTDQPL